MCVVVVASVCCCRCVRLCLWIVCAALLVEKFAVGCVRWCCLCLRMLRVVVVIVRFVL